MQESGDCKGVKIASGQVLHSEMVVASPTFCVEHPVTSESTRHLPVMWMLRKVHTYVPLMSQARLPEAMRVAGIRQKWLAAFV